MSARLPSGGSRINRRKKIDFQFNGRRLKGLEGDTVASALLANDELLVGRSFKYHRPRGIYGSGEDEPNALMGIGEEGSFEPNVRATDIQLRENLVVKSQNHWPSLSMDFLSINNLLSRFFSAGFYYKTFIRPRFAWKYIFEPIIRRSAGLGNAPTQEDVEKYEHVHFETDILVVGAGIAGITAAKSFQDTGLSVLLCEKDSEFGGRLVSDSDELEKEINHQVLKKNLETLKSCENVSVKLNTCVTGVFDHGYVLAIEEKSGETNSPQKILWKIRAKKIVLCSGAFERPIVFPDNDIPGIMLASAVRDYIEFYGVLIGDRVVLTTNNDDAYKTALKLKENGINVPAILDARKSASSNLVKKVKEEGIKVLFGKCIGKVEGKKRVESIGVCAVNGQGSIEDTIQCNGVAVSGGWVPNANLWSHCGGKLEWDKKNGFYKPDNNKSSIGHDGESNMIALGSCSGVFTNFEIQDQVPRKINQLLMGMKIKSKRSLEKNPFRKEQFNADIPVFILPHGAGKDIEKRMFVDFQNDVKVTDINLAALEGYESIEHAKRYTTLGMATDQGKTSNINGINILSKYLGRPVEEIGHTTFRPPYKPIPLGVIAGQYSNKLFKPTRKTPIDAWSEANNAKWEPVGDWRRAYAYPQENETISQTLTREVLNVRNNVGLLDSSTLGKVLVKGPDAAKFLDLIYTNKMSTLPVGKCRYGLMCTEAGFVFDDGVVARITDDTFLCHTTSGGSDRVYAWFEEWLQTEWFDFEVYVSNLTEQYSQINVVGPNSRKLLKRLKGISLLDSKLPFMHFAEGFLDKIWVRVYRISFSGELSYELAVKSNDAAMLWEKLINLGNDFKVEPYGTEALHILRAEKGFIVVGDETDGTVTPQDLGMHWIVSKKKEDFIGKKALNLPFLNKKNRKQLVGILTLDEKFVLPDGCHAVEDGRPIGHVTSTYFSPTLSRSIALGLIEEGHSRVGSTIEFSVSKTESAFGKLVDPVFYDKEGKKQDV